MNQSETTRKTFNQYESFSQHLHITENKEKR